MSEQSKKARADMKAKAKRMAAGEPGAKIDASSWSAPEGLNADKQTGLRPVSPRQFKRGGKLKGKAAMARADRKPRKSGGAAMAEKKEVADKINRNVKEANASEFGKPHEGGMKRGGKAKRPGKFYGGALGAGRPPMPAPGGGMAPQGAPPQLPPQVQAMLANRAQQGMGPPPMQPPAPGVGAPGAMPPPGPGMFGGGGQLPPALMARMAQMGRPGMGGGAPVGPMGGGAPVPPPTMPVPTSPPPPPFKTGGGVNSQSGSNYLSGTRPTGGRIARATGGKSGGGKGKTNIIIAVNPHGMASADPMQQAQQPRQQMAVPVQPPPPPQGVPMQMPAGPPPGPPPGAAPGAPPPAQMMPRKRGGRTLANSVPKETAGSYKDMTAGALSGIGRLQKTSIAKKQGNKLGGPP